MTPEIPLTKPTVPAAEHPTGHDLLAIDVRLPGSTPTDAGIELTTGQSYPSRFWRCRACGQERNRPDEFETICPGGSNRALVTDGGPSVEEDERRLPSALTVQFVDFGSGYGVLAADGTRYLVDIEDRSCGCEKDVATGESCEHLRRIDQAIQTGELPGPDGRFVD